MLRYPVCLLPFRWLGIQQTCQVRISCLCKANRSTLYGERSTLMATACSNCNQRCDSTTFSATYSWLNSQIQHERSLQSGGSLQITFQHCFPPPYGVNGHAMDADSSARVPIWPPKQVQEYMNTRPAAIQDNPSPSDVQLSDPPSILCILRNPRYPCRSTLRRNTTAKIQNSV